MEFTGERFLPELQGEIAYEHWHRYAFAQQLVSNKSVLDIACGEGYGTAVLSQTAGMVVGGDIDLAALLSARQQYGGSENIQFVRTSCDLLAFADAAFDIVVSFETIEHVTTQTEMLAEIKRVLKPRGIFCVSSPNKAQYSDARNYSNPFHVRELYRDELSGLIQKYFPATRWFHQKLLFHSAIWRADGPPGKTKFFEGDGNCSPVVKQSIDNEAMYFIVLCAQSQDCLDIDLETSFYADQKESVYHAYDHSVREVIRLDGLLKTREELITERDQLLQDYAAEIQSHLGLIAERDALLKLRTEQMAQREKLIAERDDLLVLRTQQMEESGQLIAKQEQELAILRRSFLQRVISWLRS